MAVKTKAAKGAAKGYIKTKKTKAKAKGGAKAAKGGAKSAATGTAGAVIAARQSPYVQELVTNEDLRDSIIDAYQSVRTAVDRASSSKQPITALFDDKKLQKELKNAGENIRDSAVTLREADGSGSSGGGLGRKLLLVVVAAGLALALSEDLRKKVLDTLFGAEEEFEYTSTTTSASTSSNGPAASTTSETPTAS